MRIESLIVGFKTCFCFVSIALTIYDKNRVRGDKLDSPYCKRESFSKNDGYRSKKLNFQIKISSSVIVTISQFFQLCVWGSSPGTKCRMYISKQRKDMEKILCRAFTFQSKFGHFTFLLCKCINYCVQMNCLSKVKANMCTGSVFIVCDARQLPQSHQTLDHSGQFKGNLATERISTSCYFYRAHTKTVR